MTSDHPLDRPIWSALATRQSQFASGGDLARRFPADVSPFGAARDGTAPALLALADLIPENDELSLVELVPPTPPPGVQATTAPCVQMTLKAFTPGGGDPTIMPLGEADFPEMLALAKLTRPGPFRARTPVMGRFLGIRDGGRLIAMCGERLAMDGFHEASALCTHPDHRGRGYGEALLRAVGERMLGEGATPFLHCYAGNADAIALYLRMGFDLRTEITYVEWSRTPGGARPAAEGGR